MNKNLSDNWKKIGCPQLEDMAAVMDLYLIDVQRAMNGNMKPSARVRESFSKFFDVPVTELFPQNGDNH